MENVRNYRDIKFVTTEGRRNYLVFEPNYHITFLFSENLIAIEMKRKKDNSESTSLFRSINTGSELNSNEEVLI